MSDETPPAWADAMERRLLSAMRAEMATMRADIRARIDRLQEDLTRQWESNVVELGTAEMALRKNDTTRSDVQTLTDMVLALTRQVRRVDAELRQLRGDGQS